MTAPFSTPLLWVLDSLRMATVVGAAALIVMAVPAAIRTRVPGIVLLITALVCFSISAIGVDLDRLGQPPTYRLWTNLIGVGMSLYGLWTLWRER